MEKTKVLIVAYTFPPKPGIGGRRWSKFAKYLDQRDYDVAVVSSECTSDKHSNWIGDTEKFRDKIHVAKSNYPKYLQTSPVTIFDKLMYKLSVFYVKFFSRGYYYDPSNFWHKELLPKVESLIKEGYHTVFATGAPFGYLRHLTKLKETHPNLKLIGDVRDPWIHAENSYGYNTLSKKRYRFEELSKSLVVEKFDLIISVYDSLTNDFKTRYPNFEDKFVTISNGYDKDDFNETKTETLSGSSNKLTFLFAGTYYLPATYLFSDFIKAMKRMETSNPDLFNLFEFRFIGNIPDSIKKLAANMSCVSFGAFMPLDKIQEVIQNSDMMLLFLMDHMNYSKSTKFYEYIANQKPVVVFANGGSVGAEVKDEKIGYFADHGNIYQTFVQIGKDFKAGTIPSTGHYDISKYDIYNLTTELTNEVTNLGKR